MGIKIPLRKTFSRSSFVLEVLKFSTRYKVNEIGNKFLLAGDKFMSETHLRQTGLLTVYKKKYEGLKKQKIHGIFVKRTR